MNLEDSKIRFLHKGTFTPTNSRALKVPGVTREDWYLLLPVLGFPVLAGCNQDGGIFEPRQRRSSLKRDSEKKISAGR